MITGPAARLWWGLGLSLALHGGLLALWRPSLTTLHLASPPPSLSVSLQAVDIAARPAPAVRQTQAKPPAPRPRTRPAPVADRHAAPKTAPTPPDPVATRASAPPQPASAAQAEPRPDAAPAPQPPALNRARIIQRLRADLRAHFTYPPLARRRNLEGRVLLGFRLDGSGAIRNVQVVESSGHAILDLAAERAIRRLHRVQWYPRESGGRATAIELPVVYRLTANRGS